MAASVLTGHGREADVVVIGGGLVGLCCAAALAARSLDVLLLGARRPGEASSAAAGMLAPSVERAPGDAHAFALAARDRYPSLVAALREAAGVDVPLNRRGILELVMDEAGAESVRKTIQSPVSWLDRAQLRACEPALGHAAGAAFFPDDGAVDNVALLGALRHTIAGERRVTLIEESVCAIDIAPSRPVAVTDAGKTYRAATLVLAAGAWVGRIGGLPREIPVEPVRGQMVSLDQAPIGHVTYGPRGYVVPRTGGTSVAGSTMEYAGFNARTTTDGIRSVLDAATELCPTLDRARVLDRWSGLRPVTPDLLPIIGPDPSCPALLYACGHSRNGILLAPLTGDCVAALVVGEEPSQSIGPFSITRFDGKR